MTPFQSNSKVPAHKKNTRRNLNVEYAPQGLNGAPTISHRRFKDYQISSIIEELVDQQSDAEHAEETKPEKEDRDLSIDSQPEESSRQKKEKANTRRNLAKSDETSNRRNATKKDSEDSASIDKKEDNEDNDKGDEKNTTADSLAQKSEEDTDDTGERNVSRKSQNHEESIQSDRSDMSVESSPVEFLKDLSLRVPKNKKRTAKARDHLFTRRGLTSSQNSKKDASKRAKPSRGSSDDLVKQLKKNIASTLLEDNPQGPYNFGYEKFDAWSNFRPLNEEYLKKLRFLIHVLRSSDDDIPIKCHTRLPFRI